MDKRIALIGAVVFACTGIALLIRIEQPLYGASSLIACLACTVYLLLRGRTTLPEDDTRGDRAAWYDVGWLATWGAALTVYIFRPEPYERPLAFFVLMALSCGLIALKIARCRLTNRHHTATTLVQAIVVGLSLTWTVTLMYPSLVGLDPWTHRTIVLDGISSGGWLEYPIWHRAWYGFIAAIVKTTGLEYRFAAMAVSFLQVSAGSSLLFLIGRRVVGTQVGLLAALIVSISSWHIFFNYWVIPNGLGLAVLLLAVYLVIRHNEEGDRWPVFLFAAAIGLLLFTYLLALTWLLILLCVWVALVLAKGRRSTGSRVILPIAGIGAAAVLLWKAGFLQFVHRLAVGGGTEATPLPGLTPLPSTGTAYFIDTIARPSWESAFNASGMVLGFALAIAGCLWLLSKTQRSTTSLLVVLSFSFFLLIGVLPALFGGSTVEHRWWYAAQAFGAIPAAIAVLSLHKIGRGAIVAIGVTGLSLLMMMGLPCNIDNRTFSGNQVTRYALTQGELDAAEWALSEYDGDVGVDAYYTFASNMIPGSSQRLVGINREILSNNYSALDCDIILVRDAIAYEPFAIGDGRVYRLVYDPNTALTELGYELAYSTDGVNGYTTEGAACG